MITLLFQLCLFISLISGILIISSSSTINKIVFLIVLFLMGSFTFILLDYYFLGLTYIIVYVGAIAILFLFVVMMINISDSGYGNQINNSNSPLGQSPIILTSNNPLDNIRIQSNPNPENLRNPKLIPSNLGFGDRFVKFLTLSLFMVPLIMIIALEDSSIINYFHTNWSNDYIYLTDIQTLSIMTYLIYPIALILIGILLWIVLIGVVFLTGS